MRREGHARLRFVDCNCSFGRPARPPMRYAATASALVRELDRCGIDSALAYHANQRFASPATWNPVAANATKQTARLMPVWAILPESCGELPPAADLVADMERHGVGALWAFPQEHRYRLDGRSFPELFPLMAQRGIPLFAKENLTELARLLEDCPDLRVVAVNQGPHSLDRHLRPLMDAFPNLYVETSGLLVEGLIEGLCERYGPERLLFGSAFPDNCAGGAQLRLARAGITEAARRAIAGENLERLLGWTDEARQSGPRAVPRAPVSRMARAFMERGTRARCPIIDMHGHWGPMPGGYLPAASELAMIQSLKRCGVRKIVCSSHDALLADPEQGNRAMQAAIRRHPDLLAGYWAVNPNYPALAARAAADFGRSWGFIGFKFLPDYHVYPLTGDRYRPALEHADARRLPVLVHTWGASAFNAPQMLEQVAARHPGATFIMGHSGYGDWEAAVRIARDLPNVYLELTAVYAAHDFAMMPGGSGTPVGLVSCLHVNGIIEYMVERAGESRILFGTDLPWYSPHYAAGAVLFADIDDSARRAILYGNAGRILGRRL